MKVFKVILCVAVLTWTHVQASDDEVVSDTIRSVLKGSVSSESEEADARKLKKGYGYHGSPGYYDSGRAKPKTQYPKKCGGKNQACCDDAPYCKPTLGCDFDAGYSSYGSYGAIGKCVDCGDEEQPCCQSTCGEEECANTCNSGFTCDLLESKCVKCGVNNKACCDGDVKCDTGLKCNFLDKCETCGGTSQDCCDGDKCNANFNCVNGECKACGIEDGPCCDDGAKCGTGLQCAGGKCKLCGLLDQACCTEGEKCTVPGLVCDDNNQCTVPPPCGLLYLACCTEGPKCTVPGLVCDDNNQCTMPPPCGLLDQACCTEGPKCTMPGLVCDDNNKCTMPPALCLDNGNSDAGCFLTATNQTEADAKCCKGCCTGGTAVQGDASAFCRGTKPCA